MAAPIEGHNAVTSLSERRHDGNPTPREVQEAVAEQHRGRALFARRRVCGRGPIENVVSDPIGVEEALLGGAVVDRGGVEGRGHGESEKRVGESARASASTGAPRIASAMSRAVSGASKMPFR